MELEGEGIGIASLSHLQQPLRLIATLSKSGMKMFVE